jgi:predicted ribosome quality control (RQC) complex YloA/Tae2 family protein
VDSFHFSFNLRDSLFDNANRYYEHGKHAKEKSQGALSALQDSKRKLAKIERELVEAEELKSLKPAEIIEALSNARWQWRTRSGMKNSAGSPHPTGSWLLRAKTRSATKCS